MSERTFTVSEVLDEVDQAIASALPGPIWVRGEVSGLRRTTGGAAFFRLADAEFDETALEVSARGRVMFDIDKQLDATGVGALKDGVELRARGTVVTDHRQSRIRLSLLEIDPAFTAGRLAMLRAEVLRKLSADGSLTANGQLPTPLVPQRIGLVTSRGSAAHADFIGHLESAPFRFEVKTVHTNVQGEGASQAVARSIITVGREQVDVVAVIRGGGSKLDLAVFDSEVVGRAIAAAPVPVVTGIGHEIDRTVADEAAAVYQKTPTAAGEWLVGKVADYAARIDSARQHIRLEARHCVAKIDSELAALATALRGTRALLDQHKVRLDHLRDAIADRARGVLSSETRQVASLSDWFSSMGVERTLQRGFALVTTGDGAQVIKSIHDVAPGDRAVVRFADGTVPVIVEDQ